MECGDFDEVASRLQVTNLGEVLAASAVLRESFDRGRMLRRLKELGATPFCLAEVARRLRLADEAALQELFHCDPEAADVFNEARHALAVQARALVMKSAQEGKPHAVKTLESLLRAEAGVSEVAEQIDFRRLSLTELEAATGIRRQQIARWKDSHGLPANEDGTYSMPAFIAWLRRAAVGKTRRYRGKPQNVEKRLAQRIARMIWEELDHEGYG
jgi:hypothetical protein